MVNRYATIDENGVITNVIVADEEFAKSVKAFELTDLSRGIGDYLPGLEPLEDASVPSELLDQDDDDLETVVTEEPVEEVAPLTYEEQYAQYLARRKRHLVSL